MPEDFYIKFSSASWHEGDTHYLLAEPQEHADAYLPLLEQLIRSDTKPAPFYSCAICGQSLEVSFSRYPRIAKTVSIAAHCEVCKITILFETNRIPPWISEYGSLFERLRKRI